jgi:thymidylate kinase
VKIVFLGPDGAGKSSVINGLALRLAQSGRQVKMRHLKPRIVMPELRDNPGSIVTDPHGKPPRSAFLSLIKIVVWLGEEWYGRLFREPKQTLLICDRYYHDLLVDPVRYRYGAPLWAARLIGALMPRPALWILLDAPPEVLRSRKQEVAIEETARQCLAYRAFIRTRAKHAIIDASRPLDEVISQAEHAVRSLVLHEAPAEVAHHE